MLGRATIFLGLSLLSACSASADDQALLRDAQAARTVRELRASLSQPGPLPPADYEQIEALRERFAQSALLEDTWRQALVKRADWAALEAALTQEPVAELSPEALQQLAESLEQQGKYTRLRELLAQRPDAGTQPQLRRWLAQAQLETGELTAAAALLDRHASEIESHKDVDAMLLRALIHQRAGELDAAIQRLQGVLAVSPGHKTALNLMARIHFGRGENELAQRYSDLARQLQAQQTAQTQHQLALVSRVNDLKRQWAAEDFEAVIASAQAALPMADNTLRKPLLEYLVQANLRLGRQAEAQAAQLQLEQWEP